MKNRYTIQIIGILDTADRYSIQDSIFKSLDKVEGLTVKAVSVDLWCDPNGTVRIWNDKGEETTEGYLITSAQPQPIITSSPEEEKQETLIFEEVTAKE